MENENISISPDAELVSKAQVVLSSMGLDVNTAFNIFLKQVIHNKINLKQVKKPKRKPTKSPLSGAYGLFKGKIWMADDFNAPLEDMKEYMQ
jgi:hypothetical protein